VPSRLQRDLRQSKPFRSTAQEAALGLLRTADCVRRRIEEVFEGTGITMQQYNVLRILRGAGEAGVPTLDIADRMIERAPGITRLLDRLEAKQLVRRARCAADRRQVLCWLTPQGFELLEKLEGPVTKADATVMAGLGPKEQAELIALLDQVRAASKGK
jgi:DNA-binding MarR family transcriptional regulator